MNIKELNEMLIKIELIPVSMTSKALKVSSAKLGVKRTTKFKMKPRTEGHRIKQKAVQASPKYRQNISEKRRKSHISKGRGTGALTLDQKAAYRKAIEDFRACEAIIGIGHITMNSIAFSRGLNPHYFGKFLKGQHLEDLS